LPPRNEGSEEGLADLIIAGAARDYARLAGLHLGHFGAAGESFDPTAGGPLADL
jgi:hypothetical protein